MSDRSDEATKSRDDRPTDELLAETERLLSESGGSLDDEATDTTGDRGGPDTGTGTGRWSPSRVLPSVPLPSRSNASSGIGSRLSPSRYFSPKSVLALVLATGAGMLAGGLVLPAVGRIAGMLAVAFAVGLLTGRRRYLEVILASASVGATAALVSRAIIAVAGSGRTVAAVGAATGVLACLIGYYFGRDLRDGLFRDIE